MMMMMLIMMMMIMIIIPAAQFRVRVRAAPEGMKSGSELDRHGDRDPARADTSSTVVGTVTSQ